MSDIIEESYNTTTGSMQNASALQIRLDTSKLIEDLELYLTGCVVVVEDTEMGRRVRRMQKSKPKANAEGVHTILSLVESILNSQIVQGNFETHEDYSDYMFNFEVDLSTNLMVKLNEWEMAESDYDVIIDNIVNMVRPFLSRLIKNKERESYNELMKVVERNTVDHQGGGGFSLFGGGGRRQNG